MSLEDVCTACLCTGRTMCALLESIEPIFESPSDSVVKLWKLFSQVLITHKDRIPDQICTECLDEIHRTYSFIVKCESSEDILKKIKNHKVYLKKLKTVSLLHENDISKTIKFENDMYASISHAENEKIEWNDGNIVEENAEWGQFELNVDNREDSQLQDPLLVQHEEVNLDIGPFERFDCENIVPASHDIQQEPEADILGNDAFGKSVYKCITEIFICPACRYDCRMKKNIEKHIVENHMEGQLCRLCETAFTCTAIEHCSIHLKFPNIKQHKCRVCSEIFGQKSDLIKHLTIHTKVGQLDAIFKCKICPKTFKYESNLTDHLRRHTAERSFKCNNCTRTFEKKFNLTRHLKMHTENSESKNERDQEQTEIEQSKIMIYDCANNLVDQRLKDTSVGELTGNNLETELFNRAVCENNALTTKDIQLELESDISMRNDEFNDIENEDNSNTEIFLCPACRCECRTEDILVKHIIENHMDGQTCKLCNTAFTCTATEHCSTHFKFYNKTQQHKCKICLKIFKCKFNLKQHLTSHTTERPFKCVICTKAFRYKSNLKRHMEKCNLKRYTEKCERKRKQQAKKKRTQIVIKGCSDSENDFSDDEESAKQDFELDDEFEEIELEDKFCADIFICPACRYDCRTRKNLEKHIIENHIEEQMCKLCNKEFTCTAIRHCSTHLHVNKTRRLAVKSKNINQHMCQVCSKIFKCKFNLQQHLKIHTGERPFKCEICSKTFRQKYNLTRHSKSHPENSKKKNGHDQGKTEEEQSEVTCTANRADQRSQDTSIVEHVDDNFEIELLDSLNCANEVNQDQVSATQDTRLDLELDMSTENDEIECKDKSNIQIFICPACRYECPMIESLEKHLIENHMEGQMCKLCETAFTCTAVEHCSIHLHLNNTEGHLKFKNIKHHKCTLCSKIFRFKATLIRHSLSHTKEKPFKCEICPKSFTRKLYLRYHLRCHTGERPFKCEICPKTFRQKQTLTLHLTCHMTERPFKCEICPKTFRTKQSLIQHLRFHTGENPFLCEICAKSFLRKPNLMQHLRLHTGERPFKCEICAKTFRQQQNLVIHFRCHTKERPYKCDICSKTFQQKHTLTEHLRCHTGERPFKCEICSKTFRIKKCFADHLRRHRGERPHKCVICPKEFTDKRGLMQHLRRCHVIE